MFVPDKDVLFSPSAQCLAPSLCSYSCLTVKPCQLLFQHLLQAQVYIFQLQFLWVWCWLRCVYCLSPCVRNTLHCNMKQWNYPLAFVHIPKDCKLFYCFWVLLNWGNAFFFFLEIHFFYRYESDRRVLRAIYCNRNSVPVFSVGVYCNKRKALLKSPKTFAFVSII